MKNIFIKQIRILNSVETLQKQQFFCEILYIQHRTLLIIMILS